MAKTVYTSTNVAVNSSKNVWIGFATERAKGYTVGSEFQVHACKKESGNKLSVRISSLKLGAFSRYSGQFENQIDDSEPLYNACMVAMYRSSQYNNTKTNSLKLPAKGAKVVKGCVKGGIASLRRHAPAIAPSNCAET